jgi:LL-diaminopimelate aminotransferase
MKIEPSKRLQSIGGYAFAEVDKEVEKLKKQGITPLDFGVGDPKESTPGLIRNETKRAIDKRRDSGYPSYIGMPEFRQAVSEWVKRRFNVVLDPEKEISSTLGSKEGIFNFAEGLINPGDYALVPTPGYPPWARGTLFAEGKSHFLPLTKENNFYPELDKIPKEILKKSKILWINYPNNPTTQVATKDFLKEVVDFGHDNNIVIASDEPYSEFYFEEEDKPMSLLEISKEGVVAFNSLSKRSFMTTYRVGWVGGDEEIIKIFKKVKTNIDSGTPTFIQDAAIAAYSDEAHVKLMRQEYKKKRDLLCSALVAAGLEDCTPKATMYVWQKIPAGMTSVDFAKKLLDPKIACVVTPGSWISEKTDSGINPGEGYVRFALVPTISECKDAADKLRKLRF